MWVAFVGRRMARYLSNLIGAVALFCMPEMSAAEPAYPASILWGVSAAKQERHTEVWAGADIASNVWLAYSGSTVSPFADMHAPGLKLRAAGGYGAYKYACASPDPDTSALVCHATASYFEALVGYLARFGDLTAKGFVGLASITHDIRPFDSDAVVAGQAFGAKAVAELWWNLGQSGFASVDLSWAQAHNTKSARIRLGYLAVPEVYLGLEAALNVDAQGECRLGQSKAGTCKRSGLTEASRAELLDFARGGAFVRYAWDGGEASVSAGVLGNSLTNPGAAKLEPYVTVNWLTQF